MPGFFYLQYAKRIMCIEETSRSLKQNFIETLSSLKYLYRRIIKTIKIKPETDYKSKEIIFCARALLSFICKGYFVKES